MLKWEFLTLIIFFRSSPPDIKPQHSVFPLGSVLESVGDQNYVPAVQAVKDLGKRVINICFSTKNGNLLPGGSDT
jgi:hypothetical protein